jgi:branched-subunit amino acid ABC-type transport system permease component
MRRSVIDGARGKRRVIDLVAQLAVLGFANGVGYVVASLGLTIIFGVMRVVYFAHGEFYMLGAFVASTLISVFGLHYLAALPLAALAVGVLGIVCEKLANSFCWTSRPWVCLRCWSACWARS